MCSRRRSLGRGRLDKPTGCRRAHSYPQHDLRFSRKLGISGEEKAEAKGEPTHELEPDAEGPGLREWFDGLQKIGDGKKAAAFDTRLGSPMAGGAAHGIARRLRRHGYDLVTDPEGFVVDDAHGPLRDGEIERAKQWGAQLV